MITSDDWLLKIRCCWWSNFWSSNTKNNNNEEQQQSNRTAAGPKTPKATHRQTTRRMVTRNSGRFHLFFSSICVSGLLSFSIFVLNMIHCILAFPQIHFPNPNSIWTQILIWQEMNSICRDDVFMMMQLE